MSALAPTELSSIALESEVEGCPRSFVPSAWIYPLLCCAAVLVCVGLSNPFNEAGFNDDWSYARVAMKLAQIGRMQYNGWGSPILLFQSFWALPWIRAFGFSMPVLQVAMIPVSIGFTLLVYATGRAIGLSRELAAFASIATGTSPLFVPFAASFMTDVPGCFFSMLCIYAAIRSVQVDNGRAAARWLWAVVAAGVVGGANRQIVWIAPVVLIPYLFWVRRADAGFRRHAVVAYGGLAVVILAILHFFSQPYGPLQLSRAELVSVFRDDLGKAVNLLASLALVTVVTAMPAFACLVSLVRRVPRLSALATILTLVPLTFGLIIFTGLVAPFGNCILSWAGIVTEGQEWFRTKPASLGPLLRIALSALAILCAVIAISWVVGNGKSALAGKHGHVLHVFAFFSLGYMVLVLPGALLGFAFDRYMMPIFPLVMLVILTEFARYGRHVPMAAWCCLVLLCGYGIVTTHDYYAAVRARVTAAHAMERKGIGRDRISAGFEFDGWTELEHSEYVSVVQYQDLFADDHAKGFWFWFWNHTPNLRPDYVVLNWSFPEPVSGGELKVNFRAWTPPFRRSAIVWKRSDLTGALQAVRIAALIR
jgi:Dolichyl-phosphate-mannose-protein mannosyltransferase